MQDLATLRRETDAALCLACGKCSTMCPLSPSGWFSAARMMAIRNPGTEISGQSRSLNACLTCGACEERCPEGVHFTEFVRGVRQLAPADLRQACPHGEMLQAAARLMAGSTPPRRDLSWLGEDLEIADEGEIALFVGCLPLLDILFARELEVEMVDIARAAVRLLNQLGVRPVVLAEERCCGHDLLWNGEGEAFHALAEANAAAFAERGVKEILTTCAECCRTWSLDYPAITSDFQPRVRHMAEFLAERLAAGDLVADENGKPTVTYQDPCRLGRHLGLTDAPRSLLATFAGEDGTGFVEMQKHGRDAVCCGTSGFIHCDANSRRLQSERLAAAAATGARTLATACPKCLVHFSCAQSEDRRRGRDTTAMEIEDLTVLAAAVLRPAEPATADAVDIRQGQEQHTREVR